MLLNFIEPLLFLALGLSLPYLDKQLDRLANSEKYQLAKKVYDSLDSELLEKFGGKIRYFELIQETIKAVSDRDLNYQEINKISKLVIRDFKLDKALGK